jgi:ribulose-phosphate 3-epimerase
VDGGVSLTTAAECARAGADTFVAGSALFGERSLTRAVKKMHKVVSQVNSGFNK